VILQGPTGENNNKMWDSRKFLPKAIPCCDHSIPISTSSASLQPSARIQPIAIGGQAASRALMDGRRWTGERDLSHHHLIGGYGSA